MSEEKTYVFGQDGSISSMIAPLLANRGVDPSVLAMLNNRSNGFFGDDNGLLALVILFAVFGGNFGWNGFGGNRSGAGVSDLLMQTLNRNGLDISTIASALNTSTANVTNGIYNLGSQISALSGTEALSTQQVVNAIQAGNTSIISQLAQCCCDNKLLATQQGYENRINNTEQTAILGSKIDEQTNLLNEKFNQLEMREMQNKIDSLVANNATLRSTIDNANQTASIQAYVNSVISPIAADVSAIKAAQPPTVAVPYPQLTAVPSFYANGIYAGLYNNGSIWA